LVPTLAAVASAAAFGTQAVRLAGSAQTAAFSLELTPDHSTTVRGHAFSMSATVERAEGFTGEVTLSTSTLPQGMRARWRLADGRATSVVPSGENGATLTMSTTPAMVLGRRVVKVRARGGGISRARDLVVTVKRPRLRRFTISASPARRFTPQGGSAVYTVRIHRARGFTAPIRFKVLDLPRGMRAAFSQGPVTKLTVKTSVKQPVGSERLVIYARSFAQGRQVHRYAVAPLTVTPRTARFSISDDLETALYPGAREPLNLALENPFNFALRLTDLQVSLRTTASDAACQAAPNFAVEQYSGAYPLLLRPGVTRLRALVPDPRLWPQVKMHNLPSNQDACKGTRLTLDYAGAASE
jgi:hypothetical protein